MTSSFIQDSSCMRILNSVVEMIKTVCSSFVLKILSEARFCLLPNLSAYKLIMKLNLSQSMLQLLWSLIMILQRLFHTLLFTIHSDVILMITYEEAVWFVSLSCKREIWISRRWNDLYKIKYDLNFGLRPSGPLLFPLPGVTFEYKGWDTRQFRSKCSSVPLC